MFENVKNILFKFKWFILKIKKIIVIIIIKKWKNRARKISYEIHALRYIKLKILAKHLKIFTNNWFEIQMRKTQKSNSI